MLVEDKPTVHYNIIGAKQLLSKLDFYEDIITVKANQIGQVINQLVEKTAPGSPEHELVLRLIRLQSAQNKQLMDLCCNVFEPIREDMADYGEYDDMLDATGKRIEL